MVENSVGSKSDILVMKFGGTSVGSAEAMDRSGEIVRMAKEEWPNTVVVLSAMSGVTNLLLDAAMQSSLGNLIAALKSADELRERHHRTAEELIEGEPALDALGSHIDSVIDEFRKLCEAISVLGEATARALDAVASIGERLSAPLFAAALRKQGLAAEPVESTQLIVSDGNFQSAHPVWTATREKTRGKLTPLLGSGVLPVVTGFLAATPDGVTTTLGRGGSDYSAAILAAGLGASELWIWTDVDGVMTADPRLVPGARTVSELSYLELAELAYFGAKVLHPKTIRPVVDAGIRLFIKNTFNPKHPGTMLASKGQLPVADTIKAVTSIRGQSLVTIEGSGMLGVPGVAARAFGAVATTGTNVILISQASSEQSISFAVEGNTADRVIAALEEAFSSELGNREIDRIWASEEVVIITVVGSGMRHTPGVAGKVFSALGDTGVNVVAIAQGSSEVAISLVVDAKDLETAVRSVHRLIEKEAES